VTTRTFVCRCEDVTLEEVVHAIDLGLASVEEIKRYTGLGTGPCQGKECVSALVQLLVERKVIEAERVQPFTARPPAEPVTFGALAAGADQPEGPPSEHERGGP
jgi:bacterioferritin-associated ferredoxin